MVSTGSAVPYRALLAIPILISIQMLSDKITSRPAFLR